MKIVHIIIIIVWNVDCFYDVPSYYGHFSRDYF
jgi:hypothetical protein